MVGVSHPVEAGFIKSLASPGSNVTGVTNQLKDVDFKALGLLREAKPGIDRVGVLYTPSNAGSALAVKQLLSTPQAPWVCRSFLYRLTVLRTSRLLSLSSTWKGCAACKFTRRQ